MAGQDYLNIDLEIERVGQQYQVEVDSPCGQADLTFAPPFSALETENFILRLGQARRGVRRIDTPEMSAAKDFGSRLFGAVFSRGVRDCLIKSLHEANRQGLGLRIRLRLNNAPELAALPWEYLYYPDLNRFFVLSSKTPIVRYLELSEPVRPLRIDLPLRVLAVVSSPKGGPPLEVEREWQNLQEALRQPIAAGAVQLERLEPATLSALRRALRRTPFHCLHFVGHGAFDPQQQDGQLIFEDEHGDSWRVSGQELGVLLHNFDSLRLVVLNACEGGRAASDDPFGGVAQSLIQQGCPAVIAMQFSITDESAIRLSQAFYSALGAGAPVDTALADARLELFTAGPSLDWGTPVLYMRAPDGEVFDIAQPIQPAAPAPLAEALRGPSRRAWAIGVALTLLALVGALAGRALVGGAGQPSQGARPTSAVPLPPSLTAAAPTALPTGAAGGQPTGAAAAEPTAAPARAPTAAPAATAAAPTADAEQFYADWQQLDVLSNAASSINSVAFSAAGLIAAAGKDGQIRIWRASDRALLETFPGHAGGVTSLAFSHSGELLASGGNDNAVRIWQTADWQLLHTLAEPNGHTGPVQVVVFSPNGKLLASGSDDASIRIWRVDDGTYLRSLLAHSASVWGLAFSPDGRLLASGANRPGERDTDVLLWDVTGGPGQPSSNEPAGVLRRFSGHSDGVQSVAFSPDGTLLVSTSQDETARIWSVNDLQLLQVLPGHLRGAGWAAFAPNGQALAVASGDGQVRIWRVQDGKLLRALAGHADWVSSVAFSADGRLLASGSADGTVRLWGPRP